MKVFLTSTDFQEALVEFQQEIGADHRFYGCENTLTLPKKLGDGRVRNMNLCEGIELLVNQHVLNESLVLSSAGASPADSPVLIKFFLSGSVSGSIQGVNADLCAWSGNYCLVYCPERSGTVEFEAGYNICTVELRITLKRFLTLIDGDHHFAGFQQTLSTDVVDPYWELGKTPPLMAISLQQILQCPYQGATRRLYLESKGLELIALYLEQLKTDQPAPPKKTRQLKPEDVSRIHQAKDILIRQIDNPPSLLSLARQVGINDFKLKQGFRQVFGATVFGYLHNHRMERAAELLQGNHMTVTGVACAVGFVNRGSFAAAFKRRFGVNPSDYRAAYRKQYW